MKFKPLSSLIFLLFGVLLILSSCDDIIEPSIAKKQVQLEAPANLYTSTSYTIGFWWDDLEHTINYHLQVVSQTFASPGSLVLDTVVSNNKFSYNFNPGNYQWRVMGENGSTQTVYTTPRNFTIAASSITQQSVQLVLPTSNYLTNLSSIILQWGSLYGATKYQVEIDTNNFVNENAVVLNETIPGLQLNFNFPKEQSYQWRIRAENDTAQAQWSVINIMTYDRTPPAVVSLLEPANAQTVSQPVALEWNASATAVNYRLYVFKSDSTTTYNSSFPILLKTTDYNFNQGSSGDRVYWKITAIDAVGNESQASQLRNFVLK